MYTSALVGCTLPPTHISTVADTDPTFATPEGP
jgi:hypothetical protein